MATGRPRTFDTEEALEQAMQQFWRRGYHATTTRDLESSLGINQSSLYNAFGSKSELADAAIERYQARLDERLFQPLIEAEDGFAAVDQFFRKIERWLLEDGRGCLMGRLMGEGAARDLRVADRLSIYRDSLANALSAALTTAAYRGEISRASVGSRTQVLVGAVFGLNMAVQANLGPDAISSMAAATRREVADWRAAGVAA
jgi:TetR/AcrR family transcriptional repressor of nem operon